MTPEKIERSRELLKKINKAPKYQEDFNYDTVLYGEKFDKMFKDIPYKIKE